jgi:hypothetical protein
MREVKGKQDRGVSKVVMSHSNEEENMSSTITCNEIVIHSTEQHGKT